MLHVGRTLAPKDVPDTSCHGFWSQGPQLWSLSSGSAIETAANALRLTAACLGLSCPHGVCMYAGM